MRSVLVTECVVHRNHKNLYKIRIKQFKFEALDTKLGVYTDSDCAGCRSSRKSTSGGVASTSVGVELCAMNKGAAEASGITSSAADVGITFDFVLRQDASAALEVVNWGGVGKTHHANTADRSTIVNWRCRRSSARNTFADILTKNVKSEVLEEHMADLASIKPTRREMDDDLAGAHAQISPIGGNSVYGRAPVRYTFIQIAKKKKTHPKTLSSKNGFIQ